MLLIPDLGRSLRTEVACREAELSSERVTEVCSVIEAPGERNVGDRFIAEPRVRQIIPALFQTPRPDVLSDSDAGRRKQAMQMANRDSHRRRNLNWAKGRFRDMGLDELENSSA